MSGAYKLEGECQGNAALLTLDESAVELRLTGAAEPTVRWPLAEGVQVTLQVRGPTEAFAVGGVLVIALGGLWALNHTISHLQAGLMAAAGLVLLWLAVMLRATVVTLKGPLGEASFVCQGRSRKLAKEAFAALVAARPGNARKPASSVAGFIIGEFRALGASEAALKREFRMVAGATAGPELETRFVAARPRIAVWNLFWTALLPLAGATAASAIASRWGGTEALIAALVAFISLVFLGLKLLPKLQPLLARWLAASARSRNQ